MFRKAPIVLLLLAFSCAGAGVTASTSDAGLLGTNDGAPPIQESNDGGPSVSSDGGSVSPAVPDAGTQPVVRFIAVGDTGKGSDLQKQVGKAMENVCASKGCDFVMLLGDNFYDSGVSSVDDPLWETHFVQPYAAVNAPFYAVLGNHDYGGKGTGAEISKAKNQIEYSKKNSKWNMPDTHYRFTQKHVDFFAVDTNLAMRSTDVRMRADYDNWTAQATGTWRFVFGHHPYYSNGPHGNAGAYDGLASWVPIWPGKGVKDFLEAHVCGRADFYVSGHDHSLQWLEPTCKGTNLLVSGSGGEVTSVTTRHPAYFSQAKAGFIYFVIEDLTLTATFFDSSANAIFTRQVTKTK